MNHRPADRAPMIHARYTPRVLAVCLCPRDRGPSAAVTPGGPGGGEECAKGWGLFPPAPTPAVWGNFSGEGCQFAQISRGLIPLLRRVARFHLAELMSRFAAGVSPLIRICKLSSEVLDSLEGILRVIASA